VLRTPSALAVITGMIGWRYWIVLVGPWRPGWSGGGCGSTRCAGAGFKLGKLGGVLERC